MECIKSGNDEVETENQLVLIGVAVGGGLLLLLLLGVGWCWFKRFLCREIVKEDVNDTYGVYSGTEGEYAAEDRVEVKDVNAEYELSTYDYMDAE